jgi:hypothetical protein
LFRILENLFGSHHATSLVARRKMFREGLQQPVNPVWWRDAFRVWLHGATRRLFRVEGPNHGISERISVGDAKLTLDDDESMPLKKVDCAHARSSIQACFRGNRVERWSTSAVAAAHRQLVAVPCEHGQNVPGAGR